MEPRQISFEAIGTRWGIAVWNDLSEADWRELQDKIAGRIEAFDQTYSRFRTGSRVSRWSRKAGSYELPDDGFALLDFYHRLYEATGGLVTPLIGQAMAEAGYDASYSFKSRPLQPVPEWDEVIKLSRNRLELERPALLDVGAAGKGYLVDLVGGLLEAGGADHYLIDAGGDLLHHNPAREPVRIGLENPQDRSEAVGVAVIGNQSLCASSGSLRRWGKFHHIINPRSLESPQRVVATWAVADEAMTADGLATALFLVEPEALKKQFKFAYAVLHDDMSMTYSADFPAELFEDGK